MRPSKELAGYRTQLARPYLTNNELLDELARQAWERKQEEVRARHILVVVQQANPADTLKAWKAPRAPASSTARISKRWRFRRPGPMIPASATTAVTSASSARFRWSIRLKKPHNGRRRTQPHCADALGYHFPEVTGCRDAREIRAAHIMIRTKEGADDATLKAAEERINSIHDLRARVFHGKNSR